MNFKTYLSQLNQFFDLVKEESTGPVKNLSELFGVSDSTVKRMAKDVGLLKINQLIFVELRLAI
jgi:Mn-dependent DtxR family transcriptional regulator